MATSFTVKHLFNIDEDTFWNDLFFDDAYNQALFEDLEFEAYEQLAFERQDNGVVKRTVRQTPKQDAPAAIKKLLGTSFR